MMGNLWSFMQQDTLKSSNSGLNDSIGIKSDSLIIIPEPESNNSIRQTSGIAPEPATLSFIDTTSVCFRNSVVDVTFYDSLNVLRSIGTGSYLRFPFVFTEKNRIKKSEERAILVKQLKNGQDKPPNPLHYDWMILIILFSAVLFSIVRTNSKNLLSYLTRFFLIRGINDKSSRESGELFHWHSTLLNLIAFLIMSLFFYFTTVYLNIIPSGLNNIIYWLITLGIIIIAVTLRHLVCEITGNLSGEISLFREYLLGVYQSFRFSALFLFVIVILISYTSFFPIKVYIIAGIFVLGLMYLISVVKLFIIFINRNISIFYLILYLCALEILPVLISVKYFTGLV